VLEIITFPHPTLRHKSKPITKVDAELKQIVADMFEAMYKAKGIGLAANQVNLPLQLFVINTTGQKETGEELVFINPVVSAPKGAADAEEGCLSLPGVEGRVSRPEAIHVSAYDLKGNQIEMDADGLLGRAIQHELDHLQGIMFIDRLSESETRLVEGEVETFEDDFAARREAGSIPADEEIAEHLKAYEQRYCS
jgi:peptide deformylase